MGGLRTALYNFIFARQNNGQFILRIEDTDQSRIVPGAADEIENILNWAGLKPDESPNVGGNYGPYVQSKRLSLYQDHAQELLDSGKAYRCFCSPIRLDLLRKYQARNREKIRYDGKCKHLTPGEIKEKLAERDNRHVIRYSLVPGRDDYNDLIFGTIENSLVDSLESDPVLLKSDLYPTYHLANVVDDHLMEISHVLRGSEWIPSTAKHLQLYRAFGWQEPKYAHFPLITMTDGSKMSKRNDHSHVKTLIDAGYRPTALFNFLTNTGGGVPKSKQDSMEFWGIQQLIEGFELTNMTCHPGNIDMNRLTIYSSKELQLMWQTNPDELINEFYSILKKNNIRHDIKADLAKQIIGQLIPRLVTLNDLLTRDYLFIWGVPEQTWDKQQYIDKGWDLKLILEGVKKIVEMSGTLEDKDKFNSEMKSLAETYSVGYALLMKFTRRVMTGVDVGLPIFEICTCLGRQRSIEYLTEGLKYVSN